MHVSYCHQRPPLHLVQQTSHSSTIKLWLLLQGHQHMGQRCNTYKQTNHSDINTRSHYK
jgi:hypothetical protein